MSCVLPKAASRRRHPLSTCMVSLAVALCVALPSTPTLAASSGDPEPHINMLPFRDGVDLVYAERGGTGQGPLTAVSRDRSANGAGSYVRQPAEDLYTNLQHALDAYRARWSNLPRVE